MLFQQRCTRETLELCQLLLLREAICKGWSSVWPRGQAEGGLEELAHRAGTLLRRQESLLPPLHTPVSRRGPSQRMRFSVSSEETKMKVLLERKKSERIIQKEYLLFLESREESNKKVRDKSCRCHCYCPSVFQCYDCLVVPGDLCTFSAF